MAFSVGRGSVLLYIFFGIVGFCTLLDSVIPPISFVLYTVGAVTMCFLKFSSAFHYYHIIDHQRHSVERISVTSYWDFVPYIGSFAFRYIIDLLFLPHTVCHLWANAYTSWPPARPP
jgi:hypothetical protein